MLIVTELIIRLQIQRYNTTYKVKHRRLISNGKFAIRLTKISPFKLLLLASVFGSIIGAAVTYFIIVLYLEYELEYGGF